MIQSANDALTNGGLIVLKELELPLTVNVGADVCIIQYYQGTRKIYRGTLEVGTFDLFTYGTTYIDLENYTDLGDLFTPSDVGIQYYEDFICIKAHDGKYYGFFVDYTGFVYNKIMYVKSSTYTFDVIDDYGTAWNTGARRPRYVEFDPTAQKYYLVCYDTANSIPKSVETTKTNFPTGWSSEVTLLNKGSSGEFDDGGIYGLAATGNYGSTLKLSVYVGRRSSSPYNCSVGIAYGWDFRHSMTKSSYNPLYTLNTTWLSSVSAYRGTLWFGDVGIVALEGKSNEKWSVGFHTVKVGGETLVVSEHPNNRFSMIP